MPKMHMLNSATNTINTSFIIESEKGLILFDGGFESESENLYRYIKSLGGNVVAWFLSHPHSDHVDAMRALLQNYGGEIRPEKLYYNFPTPETLDEYCTDNIRENGDWLRQFYSDIAPFSIPTVTVHKNDVFDFGDVKITVLREKLDTITDDLHNNSSLVLRLETANSSVIFLGDLGIEGGQHLLETVPPEKLHADYCQMAHHGQDGVTREVYEAIKPDYCLWCTPTWLWDNIGKGGYDTGKYQTVIVRGWMSELGIKKHYIMHEGPFIIEL